MVSTGNPRVFTEVFPVRRESIPEMFAYRLIVRGGDPTTIGGRLSYRLKRSLQGHWAWAANRVLTDTPSSSESIMKVVNELWEEQPDTFRGLQEVESDDNWRPTPQTIADFVARGLFDDVDGQIRAALSRDSRDLRNARVERRYHARGWVVQGEPSVSVTLSSRIIPTQDLKTYADGLTSSEELIGVMVADKTSDLTGTVVAVSGDVAAHGTRLLRLTKRPEMRQLIEAAPSDELVLSVLAGIREYDYVMSALGIVIRLEDCHRFGIDSRDASSALRIEPAARSELIRPIAEILKKHDLVRDAFSSDRAPGVFLRASDVGFTPQLRVGNDQRWAYDERQLLPTLRKHGLYKPSSEFGPEAPIRIGVVNALKVGSIDTFKTALERELQGLSLSTDFVGEENVGLVSRAQLEQSFNNLDGTGPNLFLVLLPFAARGEDGDSDAYNLVKSLTINRGRQSQVVYQSTMDNAYALGNIVLGVLGKTGNIPFVLAEPLEYADMVVGIDIAREQKRSLPGSISATAIARIYFGNGEFLRYVIHDAQIEGETIPRDVLEGLFPLAEFKGKRVVIHRDGYFRGQEGPTLRAWAKEIGAEFHLVEVLKTGTPRVYSYQDGRVQQPSKGTAVKLSETEAFLVSSLPPFTNATPNPLRIRTESPFTIGQAIHSTLSMTLLHYGSLQPPRLPVTIHYSDKIARMALRGIKPRDLEGTIPFWL